MATRALPAGLAQVPNGLTVLRLALIPAFVVVLVAAGGERSWAAAGLFALAGVTDQVDGWLARRWRVESQFGRFADPLADRLMIDAAVVLLWLYERVPWPAVAVVIVRDVLLLAGYRLVMTRGYEFSVNFLGRAATWALYAALVALLVTTADATWPLALLWLGVALAAAAGLLYLRSAYRSVVG